MSEIKLVVAEARPKDISHGIARVDSKSIKELGIRHGSTVEVVGKRRTTATLQPAYKDDKGKGLVRIDEYTRRNAGAVLHQPVTLRPAKVQNAVKVLFAPKDMRLNVDQDFTNFVKQRLLESPFLEGDTVVVLMLGHPVKFTVVRTLPYDVAVCMVSDTHLIILNEPFDLLRSEKAFDVKSLLRIEWLNGIASRIGAGRIVFSIPEYAITSEEERKVFDAAKKIVRQEWKGVAIEVTFESEGVKIGTLPWAEVDFFGNISSTYPDISLPPPLSPSFAQERLIPPMRRCFKTGVKKCPKKINFSPRSVVVAMPFGDEFQDAYKYAIRPALEETGFKTWKADENINNIDIMCKICQAIQESGYVLANITDWNPNVVFEIGLAYGLGKSVILVKHRKASVPVDLKGLEYIEYNTIDDLKRNLSLFLMGTNR